MFYAIIAEDFPDSLSKRLSVRESHVARLYQLNAENRLLLSGPLPINEQDESAGFSGSLIVADFQSLAAAKAWADADPYIEAGAYAKVTVKPFKKVLP